MGLRGFRGSSSKASYRHPMVAVSGRLFCQGLSRCPPRRVQSKCDMLVSTGSPIKVEDSLPTTPGFGVQSLRVASMLLGG